MHRLVKFQSLYTFYSLYFFNFYVERNYHGKTYSRQACVRASFVPLLKQTSVGVYNCRAKIETKPSDWLLIYYCLVNVGQICQHTIVEVLPTAPTIIQTLTQQLIAIWVLDASKITANLCCLIIHIPYPIPCFYKYFDGIVLKAELNAMLHGIQIFTNTREVTLQVKRGYM